MLPEQSETKLIELFKVCTKCGVPKCWNKGFYKHKNGCFGVGAICRTCQCVDRKNYYKLNRDKINIRNKTYQEINKTKLKIQRQNYRDANRDKVKLQGRNHYKLNKDKIKVRKKAYCENNKEQRKIYDKIYSKAHRKQKKIYNKAYRQKNLKRLNEYNKTYRETHEINRERRRKRERKRCQFDPKYRLNRNVRCTIRNSLNGNKNGRHWETLVGYTLEQLKKHLEKQFQADMTWDNYGQNGWVVDHKIPISVFNFTKSEHKDFKRCWALKNLQPMWEKENLEKRAKLTKHFQPTLLL